MCLLVEQKEMGTGFPEKSLWDLCS